MFFKFIMIEKKEKPFNIQYVQMDEIAKFHKDKAAYIKTSNLSTCIALVVETKNKDLLLGHMSSQNGIFDKNACEKYFQDLNKDNIEKIKIIYSSNVTSPSFSKYRDIVIDYFKRLEIPIETIPFDNSIKGNELRFSVIVDQDNNLYIKNSKKEHDKFFIEPDQVYQNNKKEINEYKKAGYNWRRNIDLFRNKEYREFLKTLDQNKLPNKITVHDNCFMREKTNKFTKCNSNPELLGLDKYKKKIKEFKL